MKNMKRIAQTLIVTSALIAGFAAADTVPMANIITQAEIDAFNQRLKEMDTDMAQSLTERVEQTSIEYISEFGYSIEFVQRDTDKGIKLTQN